MFEGLKSIMNKCEQCNFPKGLNIKCLNCRQYRIAMIEKATGKEIPKDVKERMLDLENEELEDVDTENVEEQVKDRIGKMFKD